VALRQTERIQQSISLCCYGNAAVSRLRPRSDAVLLRNLGNRMIKMGTLKHRAFAAHSGTCHAQHAIGCEKTLTLLRIPAASSHRHKTAMLFRAQITPRKSVLIDAGNDQHGAILPPPIVFNVGNPGPDNFTRVWL